MFYICRFEWGVGQYSSVGTVTHYRLDSPSITSQWGSDIFCTHPGWPWGLPSLPYNGSFPGTKQLGHNIDHPSHLAPRLKKE
jgi:hypothetical protein